MTPDESRKLTEIYDVIAAVGRAFPGYNFGHLTVDLARYARDTQSLTKTPANPAGKDLAHVAAEQYNVVAEAYALSGKGLGRLVADQAKALSDLAGVVDQIRAAVNRLEGGGTEG